MDELEDKFLSKIYSFFGNSENRPLYKVFYEFNHSSTDVWVEWIKTQGPKKTERAFWKLSDYLKQPPGELGAITLEVVNAVIRFRHPSSYETLVRLLKNSRLRWGQYKSLKSFYGVAAIGLVQLDNVEAKNFLLAEFSDIKTVLDVDILKSHILTALTYIPDAEELTRIFTDICLDGSHSLEIRLEAIHSIKKNNKDSLLSVLKNIFNNLKSKASLKRDDLSLYALVLNSLIEIYNSNPDNEEEVWHILIESLNSKELSEVTYKNLVVEIKSIKFNVKPEQLYDLLCIKLKYKNLFEEALAQRFNLNEEELLFIKEAKSYEVLSSLKDFQDEVIHVNNDIQSIEIPEFLDEEYNKVKTFITSRSQGGLKLLTGIGRQEKRIFLQQIAVEQKKSLISIDVKKIILSPDKIEELQGILRKNRSSIIVLNNFLELMKSWDNPSRIVEKFLTILKAYYNDSQVELISIIHMENADIRDVYDEMAHMIKKIPNDYFAKQENVGIVNSRYKQKIFTYCESKLDEQRSVSSLSLPDVLDYTEGSSCLEFLVFFMVYLKNSLLITGQVMNVPAYMEITKSSMGNSDFGSSTTTIES